MSPNEDLRVGNPKEKGRLRAVDLKYPTTVIISLSLFVGVCIGDQPSCKHVFAKHVRMEVLGDEMEGCLTLRKGGI